MKNIISAKLAGNILLLSMIVLIIFDVLILFKVLPSNIVWGGQIKNSGTNLIVLELTAILVTLIFAFIVAAKTGYIKVGRFSGAIHIGIWIIFGYLVLNTIGNLASGVSFENLIFAPITFLLALFALRLAIEK
jgi:hypothetical protein